MDSDPWWIEALCRHRFFDPEGDVVAGASVIITKIVIEAEVGHVSRFQDLDGLIWPADLVPTLRGFAFVVEIELHVIGFCVGPLLKPGDQALGTRF